jgi:hypothetical protein
MSPEERAEVLEGFRQGSAQLARQEEQELSRGFHQQVAAALQFTLLEIKRRLLSVEPNGSYRQFVRLDWSG